MCLNNFKIKIKKDKTIFDKMFQNIFKFILFVCMCAYVSMYVFEEKLYLLSLTYIKFL